MIEKLTIGIPTLNRGSLVFDLIKKCLTQTEPPFQIVVSDDASEDDTLERLNTLSSAKLKIIKQQKRLGMINNWNACLNECQGDWFVLVSDDDMISLDFVEHVQKTISADPDADILIMRGRIVDKLTSEINENYPPTLHVGQVSFVEQILPAWLDHSFVIPFVSVIFKASVLKAAGGFISSFPYAADAATWLPIAIRGRCLFYPEAKVDCIVHKGMATMTYDTNALVEDVIKLTSLINAELLNVANITPETLHTIKNLSSIYLRKTFGHVMITSARAGASKLQLIRAWLRYAKQLPGYGISALSVGSILIPQNLIQIVGWPYRKWVSWGRTKNWNRINPSIN